MELLVVGVVLVILWGILSPVFPSNPRQKSASQLCMQNLRQVTLAMTLLSADNEEKSLIQAAKAQSGQPLAPYPGTFPTMTGAGPDELWKLYLTMQPYQRDPKVFRCPSEPEIKKPAVESNQRMKAPDPLAYYSTSSNAFSYFLNVDAKTGPDSPILAGDSHLSLDPAGTDENPGQVELKGEKRMGAETAKDLRWTKSRHAGQGVVAFGDGHAEVLTSRRLRTIWANPTNSGVRIWLPN